MEEPKKNEDAYMKAIGEIGRWHIVILALVTIPPKVILPSVQFGIILMAPKTTFRCLEKVNATEELLNMTCYSDCKSYEYHSDFEDSIIAKWGLICDRAWLANFAQTICMFGVLVGSLVFGIISDRYGRRLSLIFAGTLQACMGFGLLFCPDFWSFIIIRFLLGSATGGFMMTSIVLLMEIFGATKRELLGFIFMLPTTIGWILMAIITYYVKTWKGFGFGLAIPTLIALSYVFWLPESPKWLISVGRLDEACAVMTSAAKWNKLPEHGMKAIVETIANEGTSAQKNHRKAKLRDLVTLPSLRIKNLCSCLIWFTSGLSFYGSNQYFGQTNSNALLAFGLVGVVEFAGFVVGAFVSKTFGRRVAIIGFCIVSCIGNAILIIPDEWYYLKLIAGAVGISCGGAIFSLLYVYTPELFPTVARNMGVGMSSTISRVGSMLAPFIAGLGDEAFWIPPAVFAVAPIIGLAACWYLPETKGKKLEDNLEES